MAQHQDLFNRMGLTNDVWVRLRSKNLFELRLAISHLRKIDTQRVEELQTAASAVDIIRKGLDAMEIDE